MATINLSNLILTMQQKISCTTNEQDLFYYSKVLQQARSGKVFVVISANNLPAANVSCGDLYYIQSNENLYVSTGTAWQSILAPAGRCLLSWGTNIFGQQGTGFTNATNFGFTFNQEVTQSVNWCETCSWCHTLGVKLDGSLWAWGNNANGQLGNNTVVTQLAPTQEISKSTNWCKVSLNIAHSLALKSNGTLWAWGVGTSGQLGTNNTTSRSSPVQEITSSTNWCSVAAGNTDSFGIKSNGTLWAWGSNTCGALGTGTFSLSPVQVSGSATNWCFVAAGRTISGGIKTDGSLWMWGIGLCGGLGTNAVTDSASPVREITSSTNWCQMSIAPNGFSNWCSHTLAVKTSGQIWGWGNNSCFQLGDGTGTLRSSPVREITKSTNWCCTSAGLNQSAALNTNNQMFRWGCICCNILYNGPINTPVGCTWCKVNVGYAGGNVLTT